MKTNLTRLCIAAFALSCLSLSAHAQTPAPAAAPAANATVGVVNVQEIMRDSLAAKSVRSQIEAKQKAFQSDLSKKEDELRKEDQELGKQRSVLSADAFEKKLREFKEKAAKAQKDVQEKKIVLDNALGNALNDIQKNVYDIVADIAKQRGFQVVIPTSQLLYSEGKLDISKEVLEQLNKKLPKVNVSFDAKKAKAE